MSGMNMRLCRFNDNRLGIVDGAIVRDVTAALEVLPQAALSVSDARHVDRPSRSSRGARRTLLPGARRCRSTRSRC